MKQYFYVLFDPNRSVFYQDSEYGITTDMLRAEHYNSQEEAQKESNYFEDNIWNVKKVTVKLEE